MTVKIGVDYDEPVYTWYDYAHRVSVAEGLTTPDAEPPTRWDPHSHYGCTQQEWYDVLNREVAKGRNGMYGWPIKHGAKDWINRAYDAGYEIHLVTARGSFGIYGERIKALTREQVRVEGLKHHGLHFAKDKTRVIRNLGLDYFLDDRPQHWIEAEAAGAETYLLDERWNQDFEVPEGRRVFSTEQYIAMIIGKHGINR